MATADGYDCDNDGNDDTYLVTYVCGHYSRSVYYPDSRQSNMGDSPYASGVPTINSTGGRGFMKDYIIGDLRIARLREKTADMDGNGVADSVDHSGSMVVNDISVPYAKAVIPGNRSLVQELAAASEDYLIPDRDYGNTGTDNVGLIINGGFLDPVTTGRAMQVSNPVNTDNSWMTADIEARNPADRTIPITFWNN